MDSPAAGEDADLEYGTAEARRRLAVERSRVAQSPPPPNQPLNFEDSSNQEFAVHTGVYKYKVHSSCTAKSGCGTLSQALLEAASGVSLSHPALLRDFSWRHFRCRWRRPMVAVKLTF